MIRSIRPKFSIVWVTLLETHLVGDHRGGSDGVSQPLPLQLAIADPATAHPQRAGGVQQRVLCVLGSRGGIQWACAGPVDSDERVKESFFFQRSVFSTPREKKRKVKG